MLFWNVLCSFVTHINELAASINQHRTKNEPSHKTT